MEKSIDQIKIKCSFTQEISEKLELGQDVEIKIKASVVKQEVGDNQDGTVDITYKVKPMLVEINDNL